MTASDLTLFDSHCHPQLPEFDPDREAVLSRMEEKRMGALVVGTDATTSREAIELARTRDFLWASVGLHPTDTAGESFDVTYFTELVRDPKVVAIGECGLDYFRTEGGEAREAQKKLFEQHIDLAVASRKPLTIHCRASKGTVDAHDELLAILKRRKEEAGEALQAIAHFFTSTKEVAEKYLALDCYISFPCVITFTDMYDEAARVVPMDRLLVETDAPFAAPQSYRGKRNEPLFVEEAAVRLAELREVGKEELMRATTDNARRVFGL